MTQPQHQPPHTTQESARRPRVLALTSMAFGLAAVFTILISFIYPEIGLIPGAFFGIIAVILGAMALWQRHRPLAASVIGFVAGLIAIVLTLSIGFSLASQIAAVDPDPHASDGPTAPTDPAPDDSEDEDSAPGAGIDAEWPNSMATGSVVFGEGLIPVDTGQLEPGDAPVVPSVERGSGPVDVMLYVDYRCPHCLSFEQAHAETLESMVLSGEATLAIHPLTFLDRVSTGTSYSSRASNLLACTVDVQPSDAWSIHTMLLNPQIQPQGEGPGHDDDFLLAAADIAFGGSGDLSEPDAAVSDELRDCVTGHRFVPFAQAINDWTFDHPIPNAIDPTLTVQGTPFAVVGGVPYTGPAEDTDAFRAFLESQGVTFD